MTTHHHTTHTTSTHPHTTSTTTTTTTTPPTLAIISPTPRAFTFPINDTPYSSPSPSPSPLTPHSPSNFRRKSTSSSSDIDRRPKKGDDDYVKRPENAFILFRRKCCEDRHSDPSTDSSSKKQRQADLSKTISQQWKSLSQQDRQYWEALAKEKKKEHEQMYPNYVYRPQRSKDKDSRSKSRKPKGVRGEYDHDTDSESLSFVLPFPQQQQQHQHLPNIPHNRHHGRSASMPSPPYQNIQIPNVYMPSCPTSPNLLPMISRRASHPDHSRTFDYLPTSTTLMPPSFGQAGQFESLQPTEFFQGMFDIPQQQQQQQQQTDRAAATRALQPLSMVHDQLLHQLVSPSSGSSSPSSPHPGPFTPTTMLANSFAQLSSSDSPHSHQHQHQQQGQNDAETESSQQLQDLYAYTAWEHASLWPAGGPDSVLLGDDFDLNAIPAIELGIPKFGEEMGIDDLAAVVGAVGTGGVQQGPGVHVQQEQGEYERYGQYGQGLEEALFGFEEMMAGHGF